ncbi:Inner membrane transport protein YeaN [Leclercia adecarboxylata]|uniref:Inner membrane transport protein YeaN n=1 Tax=Leclercia adecarboxylata TaxID=83655 RepID=A0A4U9HR60_9ENTR|nr:Inner membrane transport protein YeaN [Leclercia adecarboxylata]
MTIALSPAGKQRALLIAGILLIATSLRVTFTGAAPLLDAIRTDYALTTAQTGLLTTLPLLAFALISPLAAGLARRIGMERSLMIALLLIIAGIALRSLPSAALLFGGTAVIGCGIALGNVLLPGLIKRDFPGQVAKLTGAYSLTMGGSRGAWFGAGGAGCPERRRLARCAVNADGIPSTGVAPVATAVAPAPCRIAERLACAAKPGASGARRWPGR